MAPQFTATRGFFARGEASCRAATASSLPVPLSPVTSTLQVDRATRSNVASAPQIVGLRPTMVPRLVDFSAASAGTPPTAGSFSTSRALFTSAVDPRCCIVPLVTNPLLPPQAHPLRRGCAQPAYEISGKSGSWPTQIKRVGTRSPGVRQPGGRVGPRIPGASVGMFRLCKDERSSGPPGVGRAQGETRPFDGELRPGLCHRRTAWARGPLPRQASWSRRKREGWTRAAPFRMMVPAGPPTCAWATHGGTHEDHARIHRWPTVHPPAAARRRRARAPHRAAHHPPPARGVRPRRRGDPSRSRGGRRDRR
jgi:hypothetical protein